MKIAYKLIAGYGIVALVAGLVGFFSLVASRQIVKSFEGGEKHFRSIVAAGTEVSSYAKAAESHMMLYLTLHETADRDKFFERLDSLRQRIALLDEQVSITGARFILGEIKSDTTRFLSLGTALLSAHEQEMQAQGRFAFDRHRASVRRLNEVAAAIRRRGIELAKFETDFLNRQEAITAATEANSYATRAEGHLMLFLTLHDERDRKKFFRRIRDLRSQVAVLHQRVKTPEARRVLENTRAGADDLLAAGNAVLALYDRDVRNNSPFAFGPRKGLVKDMHRAADAVRKSTVELANLNLALETTPKESAIQYARDLQHNITAIVIAAVLLSLTLGYVIAKTIADPISRLKAAALEIGRGKLDTSIDITARDEVGDLAGSFRRMAGDLQNITVSRDYMDSIITSMLDSLIVVTPAGTIGRVNPATCELLEYEEEELVNESVAKVFGTTSPLKGPVHDELMQQGIIRNVETTYRAKDGRMIPVLFSGSVMRDAEGAVRGVVCVAQDMTVRKKMEEELIKSEKLQSVGLLAGGIAHDFNNFLAIASGNVELLKESMQPEDGEYKRVIEAEKALHRAEKLTHQLLTFSRGGAPLRKATSIGELVKESACFPVRGTSVQCEQDLPVDLWPVEVDEGQISQVINNLVMNAVQAMPEGGTIRVDCENVTIHAGDVPHLGAGDYVKIAISDEGPGIPKENLKKIFDPYFTTKAMGSGLGLAICYSVVKNHDGLIAVESEEGQGTTFSLYLPISRKTHWEKTEEEERTFTGTGTILFMDDEEAVRTMAGDVLKSLGYEVVFARDGTEAIDLYGKAHSSGAPFAAVVLDLTIPGGMGGKETIKRLRELDPQVKAIVSSGYSNNPVMANFKQYGFSGVVAKPYRKKDMGKTLYHVIRGEDDDRATA